MAATETPAPIATFRVFGRNLTTHRTVRNTVRATDKLAAARIVREIRGTNWIFDGAETVEV